MFDHAVFAGGVHSLQNEKQRPVILRIELLLQIGNKTSPMINNFLAVLLVLHVACLARIVIFQAKFIALPDAVGFTKLRGFLDLFSVFHGAASLV